MKLDLTKTNGSSPPSLQQTLTAIESGLAPKHSRAQLDQRPVVQLRNVFVRTLLLRGETDAHIARVLKLSRECGRQLGKAMPAFVRRHREVRESLKRQKEQFYAARLRRWKSVLQNLEQTTVDGERRPEYEVFRNILQRCFNPANPNFARYGGRKPIPVTVCDEWNPDVAGRRAFTNFFNAVGPRPEGRTKAGRALYSIHRIDNIPIYSPWTVEWATQKQQCGSRTTENTRKKEK